MTKQELQQRYESFKLEDMTLRELLARSDEAYIKSVHIRRSLSDLAHLNFKYASAEVNTMRATMLLAMESEANMYAMFLADVGKEIAKRLEKVDSNAETL